MIITDKLIETALQKKYTSLSNGKFSSLPYPIASIPFVTKSDILINRYFVKKVNDNFIYEVGKSNYNSLLSFAFYINVTVSWMVRGIPYTITDSINGLTQGVAEFNLEQIVNAETIITGLSKKLIDPLQYYQGLK